MFYGEYTKEEIAVGKLVSKEYITEMYCPHCNNHARMVKLYDCSEHIYRCLACLGLVYTGQIPISGIPDWQEDGVKPADLRAYADKLEKEEQERESRRKSKSI
jgi:transposase-like protein